MKTKFSFIAVFFIAGIILAATISTSAFQEAYRSRKIEKEVEELKLNAQRIQGENTALSQKIAYLQTSEFQEKVAKEKLNLQKPDEKVVVIKPNVTEQEQLIVDDLKELPDEIVTPNYLKWWNLFFKY